MATQKTDAPAPIKHPEVLDTVGVVPLTEEGEKPSRNEVTELLRLLRFKLHNLEADARRKHPFLSVSQEEAQAKLHAALVALKEFSDSLDKSTVRL